MNSINIECKFCLISSYTVLVIVCLQYILHGIRTGTFYYYIAKNAYIGNKCYFAKKNPASMNTVYYLK